jgi:AcrR family transcriptional regulator
MSTTNRSQLGDAAEPTAPVHWRYRDRVTRQNVLDAAAQLFEERGFANTRVEDIAAALDISGPTLYSRTKSKADLLRSVLDQVIAALDVDAAEAVDWNGPALAVLESTFHHHVVQSLRYRSYFNAFFNDQRQLPSRGQGRFGSWARAYTIRIADTVRRGQDDGEIRPELDANITATTLLALANWLPRWFRDGGRLTAAEVADRSWQVLSGGMVAPGRAISSSPRPRTDEREPAQAMPGLARGRSRGRAPVPLQQILDAAADLFDRRGFANTSVDDVAGAAGISKPTLYSRVAGKKGLLETVLDQGVAEFEHEALAVLQDQGPADAVLADFFLAHLGIATRRSAYVNVFFTEQLQLTDTAQQKFRRWSRSVVERVAEQVRSGQRAGCLCPEIDPMVAAFSILSAANWTARWVRTDGPLSSEEVAGRTWTLLAGGLSVEANAPSRRGRGPAKAQSAT